MSRANYDTLSYRNPYGLPPVPTLFDAFEPPPERTPKKVAKPKATRHKPKNRFNESRQTDGEAVASMVRGVLIARLDELMLGPVRAMCLSRYGLDDSLFLPLMNDVCAALFPEEFEDDCHPRDAAEQSQCREEMIGRGVIPRGGAARVATWQLKLYGEVTEKARPVNYVI